MLFPQEEIDKFNTYNRKLYKTKNEEGKIEQRPVILKTKDGSPKRTKLWIL